uniref:Uncharacterized protein n=1 Tax=Schistocephalus solidus TaxID=70667 RepID=A0A0X3NK96_SCHSO
MVTCLQRAGVTPYDYDIIFPLPSSRKLNCIRVNLFEIAFSSFAIPLRFQIFFVLQASLRCLKTLDGLHSTDATGNNGPGQLKTRNLKSSDLRLTGPVTVGSLRMKKDLCKGKNKQFFIVKCR